jgi:hypothetical protein
VHKTVLNHNALLKLRRLSHPRQPATHVHFHQGPQGQPSPCYDERCTNPRLSL